MSLVLCSLPLTLLATTGKDYLMWFEREFVNKGILEFKVETEKVRVPWTDMRSIYFDGASYWTCDSMNGVQQIFKLDKNFKVVQQFKTPGPSITGLTFDGRHLWTCDSKTNLIYKHDAKGNVLQSFRSGGVWVWGLAFDGQYLYSAHSQRNDVYRYNDKGEVIKTYELGDLRITGITYKDGFFWACGANPGMVYKFDRDWKLIGFFRAAADYHGGVTLEGTTVVSADYGDGTIYKYKITGSEPFQGFQRVGPVVSSADGRFRDLVKQLFPDSLALIKTVAVCPLDYYVPEHREKAGAVSERLTHAMVASKKCVVVERANLEKLLAETRLGMTGAISQNSAVELGKLLGAHLMVMGSIEKEEDDLLLTARVVDVKTGKVLTSGQAILPQQAVSSLK